MEDIPLKDIRLSVKGDKPAFVRLIKASETMLYRIARSILKTDSECADAMQETIMKAYKAIHTLREPQFFRTWITRILINECNKIYGQQQKVVPLLQQHEGSYEDERIEQLELREAIDELEHDLRVIINLHYHCDLSVRSIAESLDIPEGTVKSRLFRARERLAEWLDDHKKTGGIAHERSRA